MTRTLHEPEKLDRQIGKLENDLRSPRDDRIGRQGVVQDADEAISLIVMKIAVPSH